MQRIEEPATLRRRCDALRSEGERIGLVPTMGALHAGHLSLVDAARARGASRIVVSLFVNPLQFGAGEDLERYPRVLEDDLDRCRAAGVDCVYIPSAAAMYPGGFQTHVEVTHIARDLEGTMRPTHFRGVTTVVAKLFHATGPCLACFGRKDYQQWRVIAAMVGDLDMPIELVDCPTVREPDGLALSSRNRYLVAGDRARATALVRGLRAADAAWRRGERSPRALEALARAPMTADLDTVDYVEARDPETLEASAGEVERAVVLVAGRLSGTRLIDNAILGRDDLGATKA